METEPHPGNGKKRIVVLGAGFGGLNFAKNFSHKDAEVTIIDRQNHHLFQPLLYQMATSGLSAPDIAQPVRSILSDRENVRVMMADVEKIDLENKQVIASGRAFPYDYLVLGLGVKTSYFGNDHWEQFAPGLKTLNDASRIRNQTLAAFERAEAEPKDDAERQRAMTAVVVGGGPTGVEMAGALAELSKRVIKSDFRKINTAATRVVLVEGGDRILGAYSESLSHKAKKQLESLGVETKLGVMVKDIRQHTVELSDGSVLNAENIVWAAGMQANSLTKQLNVPKDKAGRLKVGPDCSVPGHPEVFALGDMINLVDANDKPVPGVAQGAIQTAKYVAKIIESELKGKPNRAPFKYFDKGNMATIGRHRAIADVGGVEFAGLPAWLAWLAIHLLFLVGLRNKLSVLLHWVYSYIVYGTGARIIWGERNSDPARAAEPGKAA